MSNSCPEAVNKNIFLMCIKVWKNFVKLSQQHLLLDPVEANFRPTIRKFSRKKLHHIFQEISKFLETTMPESVTAISQKRSFPLSISSADMTKSAGNKSAGIFCAVSCFQLITMFYMLQLGTYLGPCKSCRCSFFEKDKKFKKPFTIFTKKLHHKYLIRSYTRL